MHVARLSRCCRSLARLAHIVIVVAACTDAPTATVIAPRSPAPDVSVSDLPSGLVAYWPADGNARDAVSGQTAMLRNGAMFAPGKFDQSFLLDGIDDDVFVWFSTDLGLSAGPGLTFAAWFFVNGFSRDPSLGAGPIFDFEDGFYTLVSATSGPPVDLLTYSSPCCLISRQVLIPNAWNHIAITQENDVLRQYVNGNPVGLLLGAPPPFTSRPLHIGNQAGGIYGPIGPAFNGLIDEFQVYNRALSPEEITQVYNRVPVRAPDRDGDGLTDDVDMCPVDPQNDIDGDLLCGDIDNCPAMWNPDQADADRDGRGNICDDDDDNDGIPDPYDTCPLGNCPLYNFAGFFQPVDNNGIYNKMKAGAAVPVRFSLGGDQGLGIFVAGYPQSQQVTCAGGAPIDIVEETVNAGGSSLKYDPQTTQYIYVWKTTASWAGTCRKFLLGLNDGSQRTALFQFTK